MCSTKAKCGIMLLITNVKMVVIVLHKVFSFYNKVQQGELTLVQTK